MFFKILTPQGIENSNSVTIRFDGIGNPIFWRRKRVAVLEVPDPKRDRVTEKRDTTSLNQNGAGGRTAVNLPQHLTKWSQFFLN